MLVGEEAGAGLSEALALEENRDACNWRLMVVVGL